jgi:hypothetical protein
LIFRKEFFMRRQRFSWAIFICGLLAAGCGQTNSGSPPAKDYLLAQEPPGAKGVIDIKQKAKNGAEVVVVGRIGGSKRPFSERAAFTIVDPSFKPCNELADDTCPTPWDYCCDTPEDLSKGTVFVKFVDEGGKTLPHDARTWLGLRELQTVVVRGQVRRDDDSGFTVVASGVFIKK